jgi:hypothetical protein
VWFGWGQADAPSWLVVPLAVGTVLGALLAVAEVVVAWRSAGPLPAASDPAVRRRYRLGRPRRLPWLAQPRQQKPVVGAIMTNGCRGTA